jgi:hypothetical protein
VRADSSDGEDDPPNSPATPDSPATTGTSAVTADADTARETPATEDDAQSEAGSTPLSVLSRAELVGLVVLCVAVDALVWLSPAPLATRLPMLVVAPAVVAGLLVTAAGRRD